MSDLTGKVALVTGAGSGIGRATALAFARAGARVVLADLCADTGAETLRQLRAAGGAGSFVRADITRPDQVEAMVEHAQGAYGRIDCACNIAGIAGQRAILTDDTAENWAQVLQVNLTGTWCCLRAEIPPMLKQGGGAIVNSASIRGLVGAKGASAYAAASHGIVGLTRSAALEYAAAGIRVNAVCPGPVRTPMIAQLIAGRPEVEAQMLAPVPLQRLATADEIAAAMLWLCSDAAAFITGHALPVDGGFTAT